MSRRYAQKITRATEKKNLADIETPKELLVALLAVGGIITAVSITPAVLAPAIAFQALNDNAQKRGKYRNTYTYAQRRGLIKTNKTKGTISLTPKGEERALLHYLSSLHEPKNKKRKKWNGTWYIIMFDIPIEHKTKRDALRLFIKRIGAKQLQKSVWITPWDPREEITLLREVFNLNESHLRLIITSEIGDANGIKKTFGV